MKEVFMDTKVVNLFGPSGVRKSSGAAYDAIVREILNKRDS